jgi:HAD superfamily hydrolase (TIGR01509 family)
MVALLFPQLFSFTLSIANQYDLPCFENKLSYLRRMEIKGVIFDCDGVLVDSEMVSARVWAMIVKEFGGNISAHALKDTFVGGTIPSSVSYIQSKITVPEGFDLDYYYRRSVKEAYNYELEAVEGIEQVLKKMTLPKCIASNGPYDYIIEKLNITKLNPYFEEDLIFSAHDVGAFKPDPALFIHAVQKLGFARHECIIIEDSLNGLAAAQSAGINCLLYQEGLEDYYFDGKLGKFGSMHLLPKILKEIQEDQF